jgi:hypothetical protein
MADLPLHGGCLCGRVRFTVSSEPLGAGYCHCTRCQGRTGTSQSAQVFIDGSGFEFVDGADAVKGWRHPDGGMEKCFCADCGAHLFSRDPETGLPAAIRFSAFDEDPGVRPTLRAFVDYAAAWEPVPDDGLMRYAEGRP